MNAAARAFAHVDLAVASRLHQQGVDVGGVYAHGLIETANRAMFEHRMESGATLLVVRSADRKYWCPVVTIDGKNGTICRGNAIVFGSFKKRRATCPACLAAIAA